MKVAALGLLPAGSAFLHPKPHTRAQLRHSAENPGEAGGKEGPWAPLTCTRVAQTLHCLNISQPGLLLASACPTAHMQRAPAWPWSPPKTAAEPTARACWASIPEPVSAQGRTGPAHQASLPVSPLSSPLQKQALPHPDKLHGVCPAPVPPVNSNHISLCGLWQAHLFTEATDSKSHKLITRFLFRLAWGSTALVSTG